MTKRNRYRLGLGCTLGFKCNTTFWGEKNMKRPLKHTKSSPMNSFISQTERRERKRWECRIKWWNKTMSCAHLLRTKKFCGAVIVDSQWHYPCKQLVKCKNKCRTYCRCSLGIHLCKVMFCSPCIGGGNKKKWDQIRSVPNRIFSWHFEHKISIQMITANHYQLQ